MGLCTVVAMDSKIRQLSRSSGFTKVYEHFRTHPEDLKRLSWRQYEKLLDSVFRNQGYRTELRTRYRRRRMIFVFIRAKQFQSVEQHLQASFSYPVRPIGLEAVAALFGHVIPAGANRESRDNLALTQSSQIR